MKNPYRAALGGLAIVLLLVGVIVLLAGNGLGTLLIWAGAGFLAVWLLASAVTYREPVKPASSIKPTASHLDADGL